MTEKQIAAIDHAFTKYPELRPFNGLLRKLCFKDEAGVSIQEMTKGSGLPWTMTLIYMLKDRIGIDLAIKVPSFINEVIEFVHAGRNYSNALDDVPGIVLLAKIKKADSKTTTYMWTIKNKAIIVHMHDYVNSLYISIEGKTTIHEGLTDAEWSVLYNKYQEMWGKQHLSLNNDGIATKGIEYGDIENALRQLRETLIGAIPSLVDDITWRTKLCQYRRKEDFGEDAKFLFPELE